MSTPGVCPVKIDGYNWVNLRRASFLKLPVILNPLSIGNISDRQKATGKRQRAKGRINNQFLITGFSIIPNPFLIV
jgi:hypothetical protein